MFIRDCNFSSIISLIWFVSMLAFDIDPLTSANFRELELRRILLLLPNLLLITLGGEFKWLSMLSIDSLILYLAFLCVSTSSYGSFPLLGAFVSALVHIFSIFVFSLCFKLRLWLSSFRMFSLVSSLVSMSSTSPPMSPKVDSNVAIALLYSPFAQSKKSLWLQTRQRSFFLSTTVTQCTFTCCGSFYRSDSTPDSSLLCLFVKSPDIYPLQGCAPRCPAPELIESRLIICCVEKLVIAPSTIFLAVKLIVFSSCVEYSFYSS